MKKIISVLLLVFSISLSAQSQYQEKMEEGFGLWKSQNNDAASQLFERIANAEPKKWLPLYYVAQMNILSGFRTRDEVLLTKKLNKAQECLKKAKVLSPNNAELLVLQAMWYTVWVSFDGATYGRKYSGKVSKLYKKAYKLQPNNPRVVANKAEWDMGSARYFGKDVGVYCKDLEKAIELFDTFKRATPFHPNWGKQRAEKILSNCNLN